MGCGGEPSVGRPPVAFQHPGVVGTQHRVGVVETAAGGDAVDDHLLAGERPQPRAPPRHPPAGLVRRHHRAGPDAIHQRLVGRCGPPRRAGQRLDHPTRGDLEAKLAEQACDLGGRQAQPLGQPGRQRDRARADLHPSSAQRIRGLLRMARLHPPSATTAATDLDLVAGNHPRPRRRKVLLVLAGHPLQGELLAAVRAGRRQPHGDHPIDPLGDRPPRPSAIGRAGPASRPLRVAGRGVLGERRGLALGRPPQLLHLGSQPTHAGLELLVGML
jgi:hypothetical protein